MAEMDFDGGVATASAPAQTATIPFSADVNDTQKLGPTNPIQYTSPKPEPDLVQRVGEDIAKPFVQAQQTIGSGLVMFGDNLKDNTPWGALGDRITRAGIVQQERAQRSLAKKFDNFTPNLMDNIIGATPTLAAFIGAGFISSPAVGTALGIGTAATIGAAITANDFSKFKSQGASTLKADALSLAIGIPTTALASLGISKAMELTAPWLGKMMGDTVSKIATQAIGGAAGGAALTATSGSLELATGATPYEGKDSLIKLLGDTAQNAVIGTLFGGASAMGYGFKQVNALSEGLQKLGVSNQEAPQMAHDIVAQGSHAVMDQVEKQMDITPEEQNRIRVPEKIIKSSKIDNPYSSMENIEGEFHGTSKPIINLSDSSYTSLNYYGQGLYTTDNFSIAKGYSNKGRGGEPNIYKINPKEGINLFNMEESLSDNLKNEIKPLLGQYEDILLESKNLREVFNNLRDEISANGGSADEVQEYYDNLRGFLEQKGFEGFSHKGGLKTQSILHNVKIYWNPTKDISLSKIEPSKISMTSSLNDLQKVRPNILAKSPSNLDAEYPPLEPQMSADEVVQNFANNKYAKLQPLDLQVKSDVKMTTSDMRERYMGSLDSQLTRNGHFHEDMIKAAPIAEIAPDMMTQGIEPIKPVNPMDVAFWVRHYSPEELNQWLDNPEGMVKQKQRNILNRISDQRKLTDEDRFTQEDTDKSVKEFEQYRSALEQALKPSEGVLKAVELHKDFQKEVEQVGKAFGTIRNTLENYISNRIYKPEPLQTFKQILSKVGLKQFSSHSLQRFYNDPLEAIAGGKRLATTNLADLGLILGNEMAIVNHGRQFVDTLSNLKDGMLGGWHTQGQLPEGWKQVGNLHKDSAFVDRDGIPRVTREIFAAPQGIADGLKPLVDPDWFRANVPGAATIQQLQAYTKTGLLGLSLFHDMTFISQTAASIGGVKTLAEFPKAVLDDTMSTPAWRQKELDFTVHTGTTTMSKEIQDVMMKMDLSGNMIDSAVKAAIKSSPTLEALNKISKEHTDFLFKTQQRWMKVETWAKEVANWEGKNPTATEDELRQAKIGFAKSTNATFGGKNWEALGYTKGVQSLLRSFLLAPDWVMSMASFSKASARGVASIPGEVFGKEMTDTEALQARGTLFKTIAGGLAINDALNYLSTGHHMWENKKGHQWEFQMAPDVYSSAVRGMPGELLKLASDVGESGGKGVSRYEQGKLSPFLSAAVTLQSGVNYFGSNIWKGKTELEKDTNAFWNVVSHALPIPIGVTGAVNYQQRENDKTSLGWGAVTLGLGRFSKASLKKKRN